MMNVLTGKHFALLAVVTLGVSACSALGTSVADDDPEMEVPNSSMGRAIMEGLGAVPARQTAIDYTPRAPLVVPPQKTALVPPEDPNKLEATAAWPADNDLKTKKILAEAAAREAAQGDNPQSTPSSLMAIRLPDTRGSGNSTPVAVNTNSDSARLMPSQLGHMPRSNADGLYDATGKPVRRALVEPPVAYLEPAAGVPVTTEESAAAPQKKSWWKFW